MYFFSPLSQFSKLTRGHGHPLVSLYYQLCSFKVSIESDGTQGAMTASYTGDIPFQAAGSMPSHGLVCSSDSAVSLVLRRPGICKQHFSRATLGWALCALNDDKITLSIASLQLQIDSFLIQCVPTTNPLPSTLPHSLPPSLLP